LRHLRAIKWRKIDVIRAVVAAAAVLVLSTTAAAALQRPAVSVGIDADTTGNTPALVGTVDSCRSVSSGQRFDIDIFVKGVPPLSGTTGGLAGFAYNFLFDPAVIHVTAINNRLMIAAGGEVAAFEIIDADGNGGSNSDPLPAVTGNVRVDFGDLSANVESGDGVLSRLTIEAVRAGKTDLRLEDHTESVPGVAVFGKDTSIYPLNSLQNSVIAVDQPCGPAPTPLTAANGGIPTPEPAASATPTGPEGTPAPGTSGAAGSTRLAIDAIPTGNTPTSMAKIDPCASANVGDTFPVDVTIQDVNDLLAWEAGVSYDPKVLEVEDRDVKLFQSANAGSKVVDTSAKTPDNSGHYKVGGFDSADPPAPDSGSGVLARVTFKAVGEGTSPVSLAKIDVNGDGKPDQGVFLRGNDGGVIGDVDGDTFFDGPTDGAEIRVGAACPGNAAALVANVGQSGGSGSTSNSDSGTNTGLIVAIVVGVLAAAAVASGGGFYLWRRSKQ
jgi:hypothetical protein